MNCVAWIVYGVQKGDYYIFMANVSGIVLGTFYSLTSISLLSRSTNAEDELKMNRLEFLIVSGTLYYCLIGLIVGLILSSSQKSAGEMIFAASGNFYAIFYYAAPLSTIANVFKTKDSSSLYAPMLIANAVNSSSWFIYGLFGIHDPFVWAPNLVGASLTVFQLVISRIYPATIRESFHSGHTVSLVTPKDNARSSSAV